MAEQGSEKLVGDLLRGAENYALGFLMQGRKDWDIPHTEATVSYARDIARSTEQDEVVLTLAAQFHDIGYFGLFKDSDSKDASQVTDMKQLHMLNGARLAREFFDNHTDSPILTPQQIERVIYLVSVHDDLDKLKDLDELTLMEADTLGAIDLDKVKPTFTKDALRRYIKGSLNKRCSLFVTDPGKKHLNRVLPRFVRAAD